MLEVGCRRGRGAERAQRAQPGQELRTRLSARVDGRHPVTIPRHVSRNTCLGENSVHADIEARARCDDTHTHDPVSHRSRPARSGRTSQHHQPRHRRRHRHRRRTGRRRRRRRRRLGAGRVRAWRLAGHGPQRAGTAAAPHRRRDRRRLGEALPARSPQQRPADHRDPRPTVAGAGVVPLQRGPARLPASGRAAQRRPLPDLSAAAPARGVRHHHPVQPPTADPGAQPVRRAGQREHRRGQALGADPADHPGAGSTS